MQKKLDGKMLDKVLRHFEKEDPAFVDDLVLDQERLYITRIPANSTYDANIPAKMIEYFRGGYLKRGIVEGVKSRIPTLNKFCIIEKINFELIHEWRKQYKELDYAMKVADLVLEELLQDEMLSARNSSGAKEVLKSVVGGKWKDEKERSNTNFNIVLGPLGELAAREPLTIEPVTASPSPNDPLLIESVDPKTIDRVISVSSNVDVVKEVAKKTDKKLKKKKNMAFKENQEMDKPSVSADKMRDVIADVNSLLQ